MALVIGLTGCSAAGKSTLVNALTDISPCRIEVVTCDDYYADLDKCPTFALSKLPWPASEGGKPPAAFQARGNADLNAPGSVMWSKVLMRVHQLQLQVEEDLAKVLAKGETPTSSFSSTTPKQTVILVEGLLLLGDHPGAASVRSEVDHFVVLEAKYDAESQRELWLRKYKRSHLGKPSYEQRGVSKEAYQVYWDSYVEARWQEHGAGRVATVCPNALRLDCHGPVRSNVEKLLDTGWFADAGFDDTRRGKEETAEEGSCAVRPSRDASPDSQRKRGIGRGMNSSFSRTFGRREASGKLAPGVKLDADGRPVYYDDTGTPSLLAFVIAISVAGGASMIPPTERAVACAVLVAGYWFFRGRHT